MSDWIDKKAEEFQQIIEDKTYRDNTVNLANFWHILLEQIKSDIATMNATEAWQEQLSPPITFKDAIEVAGYIIEKAKYPYAEVGLINKGKEIEVHIAKKRSPSTDIYRTKEIWHVIVEGRHVFLRRFKEDFVVPGQASERILQPIIESILESVGID